MLDAVLDRLRATLQGGLAIPDQHAETAATLLGLFRGMIVQAEALNVLAETEFAEAGFANRRSMFEAWLQIRYITKCAADHRAAAIKCRIFALVEFRDFLVARRAEATDLAVLDGQVAAMRTKEPALVGEVEALRAGTSPGNKLYWTGLGPTALIREVQKTIDPSTRLGDYYKFESWDAHQVMSALLDVNLVEAPDGLHIQFGPRQVPREAAAFSAGMAVYMLVDGWQLLETECQIDAQEPFGTPNGF